jgi:glycosyltransferase involved in cell wall biosynthesis
MIDSLGRGGAEHLLATYAPELNSQGVSVRVVVLQERDGNPATAGLQAEGVPVELIPLDKLRRIDQVRSAIRRLRVLGPDVIHAHLEASTVLGGIAGLVLRVPTVATLHTREYPERFDRASARLWLRNQLLIAAYDRVICLSGRLEQDARSHGLGRASLTSIGNGIDVGQFDRTNRRPAPQIRAELGIPSSAQLIVSVSVLRAQKGINRLLHAMVEARAAMPDLHLLIVGDGDERGHLERQSRNLGLSDAVTFAGFRNDIADLLSAGDLFVLPTLWDALPTVVMEAMAAGLPVVASRVGGLPDMVQDGVEGVLVSTDNEVELVSAICSILGDDGLHQDMAAAARRRAESEFSLEGQVAKLATLYRNLTAARE